MKPTRYLIALVVSAGLLLGACTKTPAKDNSAQGSQPAPAPQPSSEQAQTPPAQPPQPQTPPPSQQAQPQPQNPAPTATAPAVAETAPAPKPKPKPVVIPAGTVITVRLGQAIGSKTSQQGESFVAAVAEPVSIHGKTVIPAGSKAAGTVTEAHAAGKFKGGATLGLTLTSLHIGGSDYHIQSAPVSQESKGKGKRSATMIGGGAGLGAVVGGIAGGGKGAAIGALVGGGAGTAGAAFTGKNDISLPAESALSFQLTAPITLKPHSETQEEESHD